MVRSRGLSAALLSVAFVAFIATPVAHAARSVYVLAGSPTNLVYQYTIAANGTLTPKANPSDTTGDFPFEISITPNGVSAYVTNLNDDTVSQFSIDPVTGELSPKTPATVSTGNEPAGISVSPDGTSAYVANQNQPGPGSVSQFDVNPTTGNLTAKSTPTVATTVVTPRRMAINPSGTFAYLTAGGSSDPKIVQFSIGSGGNLSLLGSPITTGSNPDSIGTTPDGTSVYNSAFGSGVNQYSVGAGGQLTAKTPAAFATVGVSYGLALSPDGASVYAFDSDNVVNQLTIGAGGLLSAKTPATIASGNSPNGMAVAGATAYVANPGAPTGVSQYSVDPATGLLTSLGTLAVTGAPVAMAITPSAGPTASFTATTTGSTTQFDAGASSDPDTAVARYQWSFGDSTGATTSGPTTSHTYTSPGQYTATLTVTNADSCSSQLVFLGQRASCLTNPAAITTRSVSISAAPAQPPQHGGGLVGATLSQLKAKFKKGTITITINSSAASSVKFAFAKKKGKKFKSSGSATKQGKAGSNTFKIKKKLKKGSYRLTATPAGGKAVTANFKVK